MLWNGLGIALMSGGGGNADASVFYISLYGQSLSLGVTPTSLADIASVESAKNITGVTSANPVVVTADNDFANGDDVFIKDVGGTTQINKRTYTVDNVAAGSFSLKNHDGTPVDGAAYGSYTSGGTVARCLVAANVRTFAVGVRPIYDDYSLTAGSVDTYVHQSRAMGALMPLRERVSPIDGTCGETFGYGMSKQLTSPAAIAATGRAAFTAEKLSLANGNGFFHFSNTYVAGKEMRERLSALGETVSPIVHMIYKQGEADFATAKATWMTQVQGIYTDARAGLKHAMLQPVTLRMIIDQLGVWETATNYADLSVAAIDMHRLGIGIFCAGPTYWCAYRAVNDVHFSQIGYRHYGEHLGRVVQTLIDTGTWNPCYITNAVRSGSTITVTVRVPTPPLAIDTTLVSAIANSGFTYSGATITGVSVTDDGTGDGLGTISITLDAAAGGTLGYAYANGTSTHVGPTTGSRGNIRDSSALVSSYDGSTSLYNWLCNDQWVVA